MKNIFFNETKSEFCFFKWTQSISFLPKLFLKFCRNELHKYMSYKYMLYIILQIIAVPSDGLNVLFYKL